MNEQTGTTSHTGEGTKKLTIRVSPSLLALIRQRCETTRETQQNFVNRVLLGYCQQTAPATKQKVAIDPTPDVGKQDSSQLLADGEYDSVRAQFGD